MTGDKRSDRSVLGGLRRGRVVVSHQPSFLPDHSCLVILHMSVMKMTCQSSSCGRSRRKSLTPDKVATI